MDLTRRRKGCKAIKPLNIRRSAVSLLSSFKQFVICIESCSLTFYTVYTFVSSCPLRHSIVLSICAAGNLLCALYPSGARASGWEQSSTRSRLGLSGNSSGTLFHGFSATALIRAPRRDQRWSSCGALLSAAEAPVETFRAEKRRCVFRF